MTSFQPDHFYHIYNRGNNKQKIFFTPANYQFFMQKIEKEIGPTCDIIAYCLMPNHYHVMIYFGLNHDKFRELINMQNLERKIGTLQSSYTRAINKQEGRVGSLFQAKFKVVEIIDTRQAIKCFNYIHRNPVKARLVSSAELWRYSSFTEYCRADTGICKKEISYGRLDVPQSREQLLKWMELNGCDELRADDF